MLCLASLGTEIAKIANMLSFFSREAVIIWLLSGHTGYGVRTMDPGQELEMAATRQFVGALELGWMRLRHYNGR